MAGQILWEVVGALGALGRTVSRGGVEDVVAE